MLYRNKESKSWLDLKIIDFDAEARVVKTVVTMSAVTRVWLPADPATETLAVWKRGEKTGYPALCSVWSGQKEKILVPEGTKGIKDVYFMADGRIVLLSVQDAGEVKLLVFSSAGETQRIIDLPGKDAWLGAEYAPGQLVAAVAEDPHSSLNLIDLDNGRIQRRFKDMTPMRSRLFRTSLIWTSGTLETGELRSRLFLYNWDKALIQLDPLQGSTRTLIDCDMKNVPSGTP
jgi:hypothetical protein